MNPDQWKQVLEYFGHKPSNILETDELCPNCQDVHLCGNILCCISKCVDMDCKTLKEISNE